MDEFITKLRRERAVTALLPLFFVSGATALVYQTIWNRELHLVFGTSSFAIATVLAAFMAGLALGGAVMARYADHIVAPMRVYGLLEIGIGVYALLFPWIVGLVTPIYLWSWQVLQPGPITFGLIQFVLVGATFILPTAAMGATLPLLARFATARLGSAGSRIGTLYAVNTAGAVFGTWLAGFILLPGMGLWWTTVLAAVANLLLGATAIALDSSSGSSAVAVETDEEIAFPPSSIRLPVAVVLGCAGFSSLLYEVAWTRVMGLMVGASVYAFSVMLLAFLIGIAIGGRVGGPLADWALAKRGPAGVLVLLAAVESGVGLLSYGLMYIFPELPFWYVWLFDLFRGIAAWMDAADSANAIWITSLVVSGAVMTPPAVLMGIAFPVAVRAVLGDAKKLGGPVGNVYAANTVGAVFGAFSAGFLLLPTVGVQSTIFLGAVVNLTAAAIALFAAHRIVPQRVWVGPLSIVGLTVAFVALRPPWDPMLMTSGMYHYVTEFEDHSREGILEYAVDLYKLEFYEEGLSTVVTVARNLESDNIWLANNGKVDASTTSDMPTQVLCSLLPMQFAESLDEVLVIGLASGITAGAVTTMDDLGRLDIVELEPAIERAARFFSAYNHDVLDNPKVNLIANDGRNHLMISAPGSYDVIVSEPSNPWITGVSNLFTKEFWEMGKTRLKPGGVWSQWVQMYGMDDRDLKSLLATFASVYPYVIVYATIEDSDLVLVGSDKPLVADEAHARLLLDPTNVGSQMAEVGVFEPYDIVAMFQMDRDTILRATRGSGLNTDDNMRIEYNAPLNLHRDTHDENMLLLLRYATIPESAIHTHDEWGYLARAYERREDSARSMLSYQRAIELSERGSPDWVGYREELGAIVERIQKAAAEP